MANTVKIYKSVCTKGYMLSEQGEGASLTGWGSNTEYYEGYDDGGKDYALPEGYSLGKTASGEVAIFDEKDNYCTIVNEDGKILLVTAFGITEIKEVSA
jgi:hypothetical protein